LLANNHVFNYKAHQHKKVPLFPVVSGKGKDQLFKLRKTNKAGSRRARRTRDPSAESDNDRPAKKPKLDSEQVTGFSDRPFHLFAACF
jgi:hypothetical protein